MNHPNHRTTKAVQHITGCRYWSELTAQDRLTVARRCLLDVERNLEDGDKRAALDNLQDAVSFIGEVRATVEREDVA